MSFEVHQAGQRVNGAQFCSRCGLDLTGDADETHAAFVDAGLRDPREVPAGWREGSYVEVETTDEFVRWTQLSSLRDSRGPLCGA